MLTYAFTELRQVLAEGLDGYPILDHERVEQREALQQSGRHKVEGLVQQAADTALSRMKDRFVPPSDPLCPLTLRGISGHQSIPHTHTM